MVLTQFGKSYVISGSKLQELVREKIEITPWVRQFARTPDPLRDIHHHMIQNQHALAACIGVPLYIHIHVLEADKKNLI